MIFIYFFCTKIAGTRHVLFVQLHSILKGARRFGFQTKTTPFASRACGQRKFGFPTKLPGRKRPSSGDFSDLRSEARSARCPLSLPHGRGVSDPSPCAPPRQAGWLGPVGHSVVGFCGSIRLAPDQTDRRLRLPQRCAAFWVPDQNAPTRGFLAQARSAANAATAARRTPQEGRQCPPLVRTPPASLVHRSVRALCSGVLWQHPFGPRPNG